MRRLLRHAVRYLPALGSLGLLAFVLRSADFGRALALLDAFGWRLPLLLLPNLLVFVCEGAGWWISFARLRHRPPFLQLLAVRMAGDALMLGLPSGTVVSESMQPYLLKHRCDTPFEKGIAAGVARKFLVVLSHGLFLLGATLLAWPALEQASRDTIGRSGLPWLLVAASLLLIGAAALLVAATVQGRVADRIHKGLGRLCGRWLDTWLERNAARFRRTDTALSAFFRRRPAALAGPVAFFLLAWLVRSIETLLFLAVLGIRIPLTAAMVMETTLILVRAMAFPVPAGLGIQDVGYVLCLRALRLPDPTTLGAAFVVLKRGKDLFWIVLGFLLLATGRRRTPELLKVPKPPDETPAR